MLEPLWFMPVNPEFPEGRLPQRMSKGPLRLRQDFLSVSHKQQSGPWQSSGQSAVVDSRHHRLSGTRGCNQKIAMMSLRPGESDLGEKILLKWLQSDFDWAED
jgi:hypothetical protein